MRIGIFLLLKIFIISCYIPVEAKSKVGPKCSATMRGGGTCGIGYFIYHSGSLEYKLLEKKYESGIIEKCPSSIESMRRYVLSGNNDYCAESVWKGNSKPHFCCNINNLPNMESL